MTLVDGPVETNDPVDDDRYRDGVDEKKGELETLRKRYGVPEPGVLK